MNTIVNTLVGTKNAGPDRELPATWLPGQRNFYYATEIRDAEIATNAMHENDPRAKNPRVRPFLWNQREQGFQGARPRALPYYESPAPAATPKVNPPKKFKNADQQKDWDTYQKVQYARQVRQLTRQASRPARPAARRVEEGSEECPSTRSVFCNTCGQEVQERFFKSHGMTCWPLMLEYPDQPAQAPAAAVPQGYGNWHEAQGTVYAAQGNFGQA